MARIRFAGVVKRYGDVVAVSDLNLDIRDREFVVLLGPSGCGKTTTLNIIAGLEDITSGQLWFDDEVVNARPPHRRDVAMVFQSYALYPHKSVYENIAFGLRMRKIAGAEVDRRVRDAAAKLAITHLLQRRPSQLSGGQRQRVALGRAMVRQPAVFLMDEPLSNLDATLRISMRAEIKHLHSQMQTTFVYVTHDQAEALTLADRIVVMSDGVVQQIGTPDQIYERPANMFVASFLGNPPINYLQGELEGSGEELHFRRGAVDLLLPTDLACRLVAFAGRTVCVGLRAEDVSDRIEPLPGQAIRGRVTSVLPIGSDQFLGMELEGKEFFFRVGKDWRPRAGETITLSADVTRLHVFDPKNGHTLLRDVQQS
jgi:multiple sugar transport system ATP-binding protein